MDNLNDAENTELTGEITQGYFSEGSGNVRDAPEKRRARKKTRIQNSESNYTGYESRCGFSADVNVHGSEGFSYEESESDMPDGSPVFTEGDSRIFTPDSKKSFVESGNTESAGSNDSSASEIFSKSKQKSINPKTSNDKKKEYRKRLKAKAKEKREKQRKLTEEEYKKKVESAKQSEESMVSENYDITGDSENENVADFSLREADETLVNPKDENVTDSKLRGTDESLGFGFGNWDENSNQGVSEDYNLSELNSQRKRNKRVRSNSTGDDAVVGYEGNGIFYANPEIREQADIKKHSRNDRKNTDQKDVPDAIVKRAASTLEMNYVKVSDNRVDSGISESLGKRTSLSLFGNDDVTTSHKSSSKPSRQIVGKVSGTGVKATDYSIHKVGSVISKATGEKDDNAGADAMRLTEQGGETVSRYGFYVAKDIKDSAFEESTKTVKQVSDYTTDSIFDIAKKELTKEEKKKLAYRRALKKKRRQAYRKAKKAAKETGKKTYEGAKDAAKAVKAVARRVIGAVLALPKALLIIILLIIVLLLIGGEIAGSTVSLVTETASIMSAATYQSSPQMIDQADLEFSYMELMLRDRIDEIEDEYDDYDEYSYTLGNIGHNPFTLINYLHAEYGTINSEAMAGLNGLFDEMYELKLTPTEETRYRLVPKPPEEDEEDEDSEDDDERAEDGEDSGDDSDEDDEEETQEDEEPEYILEEYTVSILKVELISRSMESVVEQRLNGNATAKAIYAVLNITHGLVQYIGSPTFETWTVESYYGYRRNPYGNYPELHRGLDIALPVGSTVHSAISGTVKEIGSDPMYGNYIVIENESGYTVKYASMSHISAILESIVHQGETIGYSGSSGSEPPSLHMEFLVNGAYYNPLFYTENIPPDSD